MSSDERMDPERERLAAADAGREDWRAWGPYVSARAWGTVREDYSAHGEAWEYFPHDHARSRAFRWSEDGLAAVCDDKQTCCLGLALWNGADPILKERAFGLTGNEGNHGEDVKECWWYLDSTPTHSWMRWRYHYPQREFPYDDLVAENRRRGRAEPEYELVDTGIFDEDRYFVVTVDYAKAAPTDMLMRITVDNRGPEAAALDVLPTLWFRNTWAWGLPGQAAVPVIRRADGGGLLVGHPAAKEPYVLVADGQPEALFCDNETNSMRLFGVPGRSAYPKDGINDHVVHGAATVNPEGRGTKAALRYRLMVPAAGQAEIRLRLSSGTAAGDLVDGFEDVMAQREAEADIFYASLTPAEASPEEARIMRQAFAGLLWAKQFYHYDVERWLEGDPAGPPPPRQRLTGRNSAWRHLNNADVISMPDPWEYPWYAAWDLAFHCVPFARIDPAFAKHQLVLLCREWYMHPNGQLPAYEWAFGDVNPPVHAWAALRVFEIDGSRDYDFLERIFHKLLINFTWWVNRKDSEDNNVFEGGFLGMDNVGPIDRSATLPVAGILEQSDGTAWMAMYCLDLLHMAMVLAVHDRVYADVATKFFEHFAYIASAASDLWDEHDGFFYDVLKTGDGRRTPLRVRSMVGLMPLVATMTLGEAVLARMPRFAQNFHWFLRNKPEYDVVVAEHVRDGHLGRLLAVVGPDRLSRILPVLLDEAEFLSPYGVRSVSRAYSGEPFVFRLDGFSASVDYEPAESTTALFGGNSNWRGPIWFPVNFLVVEALRRYGRFFGADLKVEFPTGSGSYVTLDEIADRLAQRLVALFLPDADGRRPVAGQRELLRAHPDWRDLVWFHEYFDAETGAGLGASHQTGWTALVAELILTGGCRTDRTG